MSDALGHAGLRRPCGPGAAVPVTWLWVLVAAVWGAALVGRPGPPAPPPEAGVREPTAWEQVAQGYGDFRTEDQIRKDNRLVFAVWDGDEAKARRALAAGADPNA